MVKDSPKRATALADEAELAYSEALDRIEFAKTFGFQSLELDGLKFLERLPDQIVELRDLKRLSIDGTFIHDLRLVANLKQLQRISFNKTRVSDLSPLSELVELESVSADRTDVSDLQPLSKLGKLKRLSLRRTRVRDVGALRGLENLETLDLYWTPIRDISGLSSLRSLRHLSLERTKVEALSPLSNLTQLRSLQLYWTRVADLTPLSNHSELRRLSIGRTRVGDLAPIARMTGLADAAVVNGFFWSFDFYDTPAFRAQRENEKRNGRLSISLPEPHKTVGLINEQRLAQGLRPYFPAGYESLEVLASFIHGAVWCELASGDEVVGLA